MADRTVIEPDGSDTNEGASVAFDELERLTLPGFYSAALEYFATGEGLTRALHMGRAQDTQDLRAQLEARCTPYLARCCRVQLGLKPLPGFEGLLPKDVASTLARLESQRLPLCNLTFALTFHFNVS